MRKLRLLLSDGTPVDLDIPRQSLSNETLLNLFAQRQDMFKDDWIPTGTGDCVLNRYQVVSVTVIDDETYPAAPSAQAQKKRTGLFGFLRRRETL